MRITMTAMLAMLVLIAGCQNAQLRERRARRDVNLARTRALLHRIESRRSANLKLAGDYIEESFAEDVEQTRRNKTALKHWWDEEFNRWERTRHFRDARFSELLAGDAKNIERTWPKMLE